MIRITAGEFRGRTLKAPKDLRTRPTQAKLRQALFNSIQSHIPHAQVLDLFAGTGALGLEALSRGAAHATFVEHSRLTAKILSENIRDLGVADRSDLITDSMPQSLSRIRAGYDIVLADPPYADGWELRLLEEIDWNRVLVPEGVFCLEWGIVKSEVDALPDETAFLVKIREKNYGDSVLTTYSRKPHSSDPSDE